MKQSFNWWVRKLHRWGSLLVFVPLIVVIVSGLLLQVKKQVGWVQPPTISGSGTVPSIDWQTILDATCAEERSQVNDWSGIDRLDVRPDKGIIKIRCKNRWEIQVDAVSGDVLSSAYRRSDLIESLHDGSFFSDELKLWVFLPNGAVLLGLWCTGIYLWYLPYKVRRKKKRRLANKS